MLELVSGETHVKVLSQRLAELANSSRKNIDKMIKLEDQATADIFIEIVRTLDKDLWFLQAHLQ